MILSTALIPSPIQRFPICLPCLTPWILPLPRWHLSQFLAFEGEEYDASLADVAKQYYDRANVRLQYIVSILHGDIPEEIYTYEDDSEDDSSQPDSGAASGETDPSAEEDLLTETE